MPDFEVKPKPGDFMWYEESQKCDAPRHMVHIIQFAGVTETPAGTKADAYTARCGEEGEGYGYGALTTWSQTLPSGHPLCPKCFPPPSDSTGQS